MVLSREQLLSLIDMLDEWVYQNKLDKANYSESEVTCGNFKNMYRISPFKTLCKLIVTHYKSIVYKDDKHSLLITDYRELYKILTNKCYLDVNKSFLNGIKKKGYADSNDTRYLHYKGIPIMKMVRSIINMDFNEEVQFIKDKKLTYDIVCKALDTQNTNNNIN